MGGIPLYVAAAPPPPLEQALRARGVDLIPVRWDDHFYALAPAAADAGPLHCESGGGAALKGRRLLASADSPCLSPMTAYARFYGLRPATFTVDENALPAASAEGASCAAEMLPAPDHDGWEAAVDLLLRPPAPRRIRLRRGGCGGPAAELGAALADFGVVVLGTDAAGETAAVAEDGDWLLATDEFAPGESPRAVIAAARAQGLKVAFICRGEGLENAPAAGAGAADERRDRISATLEAAEADALLATSADAAERLRAFYFRFLPRLVNLSWKIAVCPPPAVSASGACAVTAWKAYAGAVATALFERGPPPPPPPAPADGDARPLLSICFTTYNRAEWLAVSLRRMLEQAEPYGDRIEVVVCDNASKDATPAVVARHAGDPRLRAYRNPVNVGMLGNLGVTARHARGRFVWLLGDDDLPVEGVIEDVLEGLIRHPDVHMAYLNYAVTGGAVPADAAAEAALIRAAVPSADGGENRRVARLRDAAVINDNLFTAIYACIFRRDHALLAYGQNVSGPPFSSLETSAPSAAYAVRALMDLPAYWIGRPGLAVNANVSWKEYGALWVLERLPELCDLAERAGADPVRLDACRADLCRAAAANARRIYLFAGDEVRGSFLLARLLERCKHLDDFRRYQAPLLFDVYRQAQRAGKISGAPAPEELFGRFGLAVGRGVRRSRRRALSGGGRPDVGKT